jgi:hypothetical protein
MLGGVSEPEPTPAPTNQERLADRAVGRVAYWVFGLFGAAVLAMADLLASSGSIRYTDESIEGTFHTGAFIAVMGCAALGLAGVLLARVQTTAAIWALRLAALGAAVAAVYAMAQSEFGAGAGVLLGAALPLFVAASFVGWAERPAS